MNHRHANRVMNPAWPQLVIILNLSIIVYGIDSFALLCFNMRAVHLTFDI